MRPARACQPDAATPDGRARLKNRTLALIAEQVIKARRRKRLRGEPVQPVEKPKRSECADAIDEFASTLLRHMRAE